MPHLRKRRADHELLPLPEGMVPSEEVFVVRFTGEVFRDYEAYLKAVSLYRQRVWSCKLTGKSGLTYEEAITCERESKSLALKFPEIYVKPTAELVQWSLARADELCTRVLSHYKDYFVPGEEVLGMLPNDAGAGSCRVISMLEDGGASEGADPAESGSVYEVEWLGGPEKGERAALGRSSMTHKGGKAAISRAMLKAWLEENAVERPLRGAGTARGALVLWRVEPSLAQTLNLPPVPPQEVTRKVEQIEGRAPKAAAPAEPAPGRGGGKRCSDAPAAAAAAGGPKGKRTKFADVGAMELFEDLQPGDGGEGEEAAPKLDVEAMLGVKLRHPSQISTDNPQLKPELAERFEAMLPAVDMEEAARVAAPVESPEETEARMPPGSVKHAIFSVLREQGVQGLSIYEIMVATQDAGLKEWGEVKTAKNSIASTCLHDPAFARVAKGRFALRSVKGVAEAEASARDNDAVMSMAAKAAEGIEAQAMKAVFTVVDRMREDAAVKRENRMKCAVCLLTRPLEANPFVMCDICQASQHLGCIAGGGRALGDLPEGDWHCDKCEERKETIVRRVRDMEAKQLEALEKIAATEQERVEKVQKTARERLEKDRVRQEKEQRKAEERLEKEKKKAEERKRALLESRRPRYPKDDEKVLLEEEALLEHMNAVASMTEEELAEAAPPELDTDDEDGLTLAVADCHRTWCSSGAEQRQAALRAAEVRHEGPPAANPLPEQCIESLGDAAVVAEFMCRYAYLLELPVAIGLADLRQAAQYPLDSTLLADIYCHLLRLILLDCLSPENRLKSRARRWARVFDEYCWPEVLRRYLLVAHSRKPRIEVPEPSSVSAEDMATLDPDRAALLGGMLLGRQQFHELPPQLHIRLLRVLVDDLVCTNVLRSELDRRLESTHALNMEWLSAEAEDKRALKAHDEARKEQLRNRKEDEAARRREEEEIEADAAAEEEQEAPSVELPPELQEFGGAPGDEHALSRWQRKRDVKLEQLEKRRSAWEDKRRRQAEERRDASNRRRLQESEDAERRDAEVKAVAEEDKASRAADRKLREAVYMDNLRDFAVRLDPMGLDRNHRRFFWLEMCEPRVVLVESPDGESWECIYNAEGIESIKSCLNVKGTREAQLHKALERAAPYMDPSGVPVPMEELPKPSKRLAAAAKRCTASGTILGALRKLEVMCSELSDLTEVKDFKERSKRMKAAQVDPAVATALHEMVELEELMGCLGNGLPKGADNESLTGALDEDAVAVEDFAIIKVKSEYEKKKEREAAAAGGDLTRAGSSAAFDAEGLEEEEAEEEEDRKDAVSEAAGEANGAEDEEDEEQEEDAWDEDAQEGEEIRAAAQGNAAAALAVGLGPAKPKRGRKPRNPGPLIILPEEMEFSDGEQLTSHTNHARTIWRTARERAVWLRYIARARKLNSAALVAYAAAALADRTAPFLKKRSVGRRGATAFEEVALRNYYHRKQHPGKGHQDAPSQSQRSKGGSSRQSREDPAPPALAEPAPQGLPLQPNSVGDDGLPFVCAVCGIGGDLLCCDGDNCPVVMHTECAGLAEVPGNDWLCPNCVPGGAGPKSRARGRGRAPSASGPRGPVPRSAAGGRQSGRASEKGPSPEAVVVPRATGKRTSRRKADADFTDGDDEEEEDKATQVTRTGRVSARNASGRR